MCIFEHLDVDIIKIHGSFTKDLSQDSENTESVQNLIKKVLECEKVAIVPYVENANILATLWSSGVHYIQGHYLQEPTDSMSYDFSMEG